MNEVVRSRKHTARACCLIQYGDLLVVIENIITALCKQNVYHELDNISARVVIASLGIFREPTDQVLKDIAHLNIVNGLRIEVKLRECLYHRQQTVILIHLVDLLVKVKALDDVLHIGRKALDVVSEIRRKVVGIIDKLCKGVLARIEELIPRHTAHRLCRVRRILLVLLHDSLLRSFQCALKAADNDHRNNNVLVLVALICTSQLIGNRPNEAHLGGNIYGSIVPHYIYFLINHCKTPLYQMAV